MFMGKCCLSKETLKKQINYEQALEFYAQAEAIFVQDADIICLETNKDDENLSSARGLKMKSLLEDALAIMDKHQLWFKGEIYQFGAMHQSKATTRYLCSIIIRRWRQSKEAGSVCKYGSMGIAHSSGLMMR